MVTIDFFSRSFCIQS